MIFKDIFEKHLLLNFENLSENDQELYMALLQGNLQEANDNLMDGYAPLLEGKHFAEPSKEIYNTSMLLLQTGRRLHRDVERN